MLKRIILIFLFFDVCSAQEDTLKSYFPLTVGNLWQYKVTCINDFDTIVNYKITEILKDTIIGNPPQSYLKTNVAFSGFPFLGDSIKYLKYDSLLNSVIEYQELTGGENLFLKLDATINECWDYCGENFCCIYIGIDTIFQTTIPVKGFADFDIPPWGYDLAYKFGPIRMWDDESHTTTGFVDYDLIYARIDGIVYGTQYTSLKEGNEKPSSFSLSQNYPNPFNPLTTITYSLPQTEHVVIKVFDIIGNEVTILVDRELSAGTYSVLFEGTKYASGIYYYRMHAAENFNKQKK